MRLTRKAQGFTLVEIMIVVAIIGIIIAIAVPGFIRARTQSRIKSCQENLVKIDGAKEQWALENNEAPGASVTESDLVTGNTGYLKKWPTEPAGYSYTEGNVGVDPICESGLPGHSIDEIGDIITI